MAAPVVFVWAVIAAGRWPQLSFRLPGQCEALEDPVELKPYNGAVLLDFVRRRMTLSSDYQPLVIQALVLARGHRLPADDLARQLLLQDRFAVSKALKTVMRWPKITLGSHGIAYYDRKQREFVLPVAFESNQQREEVLAICAEAISTWQKEAPKVASQFYRLVEAVGGRCQACGVSAEFRPLDIDHVVPRARARHGYVTLPDGTGVPADDERNLQVLCARCNRGKRDASTYDFRPSAERFSETISLALRAAGKAGYSRDQVLAAALEQLTSAPLDAAPAHGQ
jgi:5-methylcytosine-specific restriction endonuclease McrA